MVGTIIVVWNREELQDLDTKRQQTNVIVLGLALLGLMIGLMENELMWHNRNIPVMSYQLIKLLNLGITAVLFYFVLRFRKLALFFILVTATHKDCFQVLFYRVRTFGGVRENRAWSYLLAGIDLIFLVISFCIRPACCRHIVRCSWYILRHFRGFGMVARSIFKIWHPASCFIDDLRDFSNFRRLALLDCFLRSYSRL
jgi:hypothetical protein